MKISPLPDVVLVIEPDDYTYRRKSAPKRDAEKDANLDQAGLPILRVPVTSAYGGEDLRNKIHRLSLRKTRRFNVEQMLMTG